MAFNFNAPVIVSGNYSMSFWSFKTAFSKNDEDNFDNEVFQSLLDNRAIISERIAFGNDSSRSLVQGTDGRLYSEGYGGTAQEVLLYSFMSAYSAEDANSTSLKDFTRQLPKPNWNITYDGLSKLAFFKKYFKSVTLGHSYRSYF